MKKHAVHTIGTFVFYLATQFCNVSFSVQLLKISNPFWVLTELMPSNFSEDEREHRTWPEYTSTKGLLLEFLPIYRMPSAIEQDNFYFQIIYFCNQLSLYCSKTSISSGEKPACNRHLWQIGSRRFGSWWCNRDRWLLRALAESRASVPRSFLYQRLPK